MNFIKSNAQMERYSAASLDQREPRGFFITNDAVSTAAAAAAKRDE